MNNKNICAFRINDLITEMNGTPSEYWIIFVNAGILNVTLQEESFHAIAGQTVIIEATSENITFQPENGFDGYVIQINDMIMAELVQRYLLFMNVSELSVNVLPSGNQQNSIRTVIQNIVEEASDENEPSEMILNLLLQELMVRLFRGICKSNAGTYSNKAEVASRICTMLENEYYRPFTLKMISGEYNMSPSYLAHMFKEITGMPVMRYLLLVRIRAAQEYLKQSALPVNEIAEKCGFNDLSNFGRTFRKETGCSPRQYRQAHLMNMIKTDK